MKKLLLLSCAILLTTNNCIHSSEQQDTEKQKTLSLIVGLHTKTFGVDHLFDQKIDPKAFIAWLKVGSIVKNYVLNNSKDFLGKQDSSLVNAFNEIEKANNALVDGIIVTYVTKNYTDFLIKEAKVFQDIENNMHELVTQLKNTRYLTQSKKNAQDILISYALFIETTAKKANKDTRMGHRQDVTLPIMQQAATTAPPIPTTPPPAIPEPLFYEKEPTEAAPTRLPPAPPGTINMPPQRPLPSIPQ